MCDSLTAHEGEKTIFFKARKCVIRYKQILVVSGRRPLAIVMLNIVQE